MKIKFKKLIPEAEKPERIYKGDAGFDFRATSVKRIGWFKWLYGTGIAVEIPKGYEGEVRSRSSIHQTGMILSNGVGTIDAGYRGEIMAVFWKIPFVGKKYEVGERIFQMIIKSVPKIEYIETDELSMTQRGTGGYGSSGR